MKAHHKGPQLQPPWLYTPVGTYTVSLHNGSTSLHRGCLASPVKNDSCVQPTFCRGGTTTCVEAGHQESSSLWELPSLHTTPGQGRSITLCFSSHSPPPWLQSRARVSRFSCSSLPVPRLGDEPPASLHLHVQASLHAAHFHVLVQVPVHVILGCGQLQLHKGNRAEMSPRHGVVLGRGHSQTRGCCPPLRTTCSSMVYPSPGDPLPISPPSMPCPPHFLLLLAPLFGRWFPGTPSHGS